MVALLSGELHHVQFQLNTQDIFSVHLPLDATTLRRFGATHVVFVALRESQAVSAIVPRLPDLVYLRSAGRFHLFRIVNERDPH